MTYLLTRRYKISAAHHLFGLGETHKCARPHGHNYTIDLTLSTQSLNNGMVLEMGALDVLVERIVERLDHVDLNAFDDGSPHGQAMAVQPTAENIAGYLLDHPRGCTQSSKPQREHDPRARMR